MDTPKIDSRDRRDILEQLRALAASYVPEWRWDDRQPDAGAVLAHVYAELMENTISKYNRSMYNHYRGADSVNSFLARFLSVFQSIYVDLEDHMDLAPVRFDPAAAPPEFLRWLAEGLAVSDSFLWSEEQLRELLRRVVRLYRWKGTRTALCEVVELYTGHRPWVVEQFEAAGCELWQRERETLRRLYGEDGSSFTLLLPPGRYDADGCAKLLKIIEQFKPIDAVCSLVILEDAIALGRHCYLGVNSRIAGSEALVLENGAGRSNAPYLTQSPTGGEL